MSKTRVAVVTLSAVAVGLLLWAMHHVDLLGIMKRIHGG
jgi:NO-binding membrane sensor protein with MHYT domain